MLWATHALAAPQEECVGRYRLTLPDEADVALTIVEAFREPRESNIRFPDGLIAPLSSFVYNGTFYISDGISRDGYDGLVNTMKDRIAKEQDKSPDERPVVLSVQGLGSYAWTGGGGAAFYAFKDGKTVSFVTRSDDRNTASTTALEVLTHLQPRAAGEVPTEPGVCLPGVFVRTSQQDKTRIVGVSYRLKRHPDVLIFFRDTKVQKYAPRLTSRQENEFVWTSAFGVGKSVKLHGAFPWRTVKLDGREGVGSLATITRRDDSTDYGYLVTVQGDADATVDTPDLLLYVVRNAAAANGKTPVSEGEIEEIGREVAASIKRR